MGFHVIWNARITAIDAEGKSFVADVGENDLWYFPTGIPHSIQGLNPDGALFLLVLLLMIGCGLALSIEVAVTRAERRAQELANKKDRISLDLLLMSDSIRGLLLDPKSEADCVRDSAAASQKRQSKPGLKRFRS